MDTADPINGENEETRGNWSSTDVEDHQVVWPAPPRLIYVVEDRSNIYKAYIDRLFAYQHPIDAMKKAKELGFQGLPTVDQLFAGHVHTYADGYTNVVIFAVELS